MKKNIDEILATLSLGWVVKIECDSRGSKWTEMCDECFETTLTPKETRILGKWLVDQFPQID